jgi:lysophospholipase L1-like esterase
MMLWVLGGVVVVAAVTLLVEGSRPRITQQSRVLLIGSSSAVGLTPELARWAAQAGVAFRGHGIIGSRIDTWARSSWLASQLAEYRPTLVLVVLGTNDAYMGGDVWAKQAPYLERLLGQMSAAGAEVVWVGSMELVDYSPTRRPDRAFLARLEAQVPHYFDTRLLALPRAPDQLHTTPAGYALWAEALWKWLT